ncbi:heme oxygenase (biliverdin-producing) [Corynebacterium meridianum]|uniref:heme oxygenase (biliverdin-producing) n=1 Tax=Corynebacterium meridianum TaxID=2765363 RepID=A0A934I510_9CORY|nr:biliverdin-producing heme oxygenase [Corynebacterium meridianum]MBI8989354.1 biliverdin-producing heme oxygenase [Corynebacterium meridianum]MCK7676986.1 biliverdin-producing heme oxygenase [Corynebacterium meridianum]
MTTAIQSRQESDFLPLSEALKSSTADAHKSAEYSTFTQDLMAGKLTVADFIALQEQSWLFYRALENAARVVADDPIAAAIVDPALERVPSIEADLDALHGNTEWRGTVTPLPATAAYVARLNEIADTADAPGLIAHHYVRYLGDLSGGQVIARMMQRHYGLGPEVLSFYRFAEIPKIKPYKDSYRAALDSLPLEASDRERLLDEACAAFLFNFNLFADLGRTTR